MIYIASPYSHQLDSVRYERFTLARAYAHHLMAQGRVCFSPIAYGRQFEKVFSVAPDVLKLDGWLQSRGVTHEIALANDHGIPVSYVEPV